MSREIIESFYDNHTRDGLIEEIVDLSSLNTTLLQENESLTEKNQLLDQENKNLEASNSNSKIEAWFSTLDQSLPECLHVTTRIWYYFYRNNSNNYKACVFHAHYKA